MRHLPPDVIALAERQLSTVARRQLVELGCSTSAINRWLRAGVLTRVIPGQYRVAGAAEDALQQVAADVRRCGDGARVGGPLALALHGIEGFHLSDPHHILIPPHRRATCPSRRVMRTTVPEIDEAEVCDIPTVTVERAFINAAAVYPQGQIRRGYYFAKRHGLVREKRLKARAHDLGRTPGAPEMRALITTGALGMDSEGEWNFIDRVFRPGDPVPEPQVEVAWRDRTFRLDFAYREARLALEYNSRQFHGEAFDQDRDSDRQLALAELRLTLAPALARLPDREQQILRMRFYGNLTQSEIARRIGVSQMHVSRLLARSLQLLRNVITDDW
jgi:RNA polymerase sigma factor (sigma-70 family)